jgi:predicted dienelactone hydrolase
VFPRRAICAFLFVLTALTTAPGTAAAVGFRWVSVPDPDGKPIELAIWYPSDAAVSTQQFGLFKQDVAPYAAIAGASLPLIVISHGTGGGASSHYDTALALAGAGFVVAAPSHTGDNYSDRGVSFTRRNFIGRPRQISRIIDYLLKEWDGRGHIDPARIGMFGHSAGGATVLIAIGGTPDFALAVKFCVDHPAEWGCVQAKQAAAGKPTPESPDPPQWVHDARIKAAAIAAPALGPAFTKEGLAAVAAPLQVWRAENDQITPNTWYADAIEAALPQPPEDHLVAKAGHFDFLAPCSEALAKVAPEICQDEAGFDRTLFHQELNQKLIAFFQAKLAPR